MPNNMIALFVSPTDRAKLLALIPESLTQYAQPEEDLHLTLLHWEGDLEDGFRETLLSLADTERGFLPMNGKVQGWGVFEKDDKRVLYASYDHYNLPNLRQEVIMRRPPVLMDDHGFTPHITLAYLPKDTPIPDMRVEPFDLTFDRLYVASDSAIASNGPVEGVQEIGQSMETQFSLAKSVNELPNGDLEITVVGVPFYGPEYLGNRDFSKEYFDKSTDIGPLSVVLSYFHHGKDPMFGKELLGTAEYLGMEPEEGHFYKIIVDKAAKYRNAIKALAANKWLGASSTPFQRTAEKDADGKWKRWHVVEVCLTYQPDNPEADVKSVIEKSIGETMEDKNVNQTPPSEEAGADNAKSETPDLVKQIEKAFEEAAQPEETPALSVEQLIEKSIEALEERLMARFAGLEKSLTGIEVALPLMVSKLAAGVKQEVKKDLQKSAPEKAVEEAARRSATRRDPTLPADAPGNY